MIFELAAFPFILGLYLFLKIRYKNRTEKEKSFSRMVFFVMLADILDVAIVFFNYNSSVPSGVIIILNTFDHLSAVCASFCTVMYIYAYIPERRMTRIVSSVINQIMLVVVTVLYLQNLITGNILGYDSNRGYFEGPLFLAVAYGVPLYFEIFALVVMIKYRKYFRSAQLVAMTGSSVVLMVFSVMQLTLLQGYLLSFFASSLAMYILFLSHETPDYYALEQALVDLERSKEEEHEAKLKAIAADEAKTQFLSQMSHEIRTPINAIMGYNNIIMEDTDEAATREYSRKARLAARRLLDFFEGVFSFIDIEGSEERLREIAEGDDEVSDDPSYDDESISSPFTGAEELNILVVDDTEMNVDLLVRILRTMGFGTDSAPDGEKALERIRSNKYDLIFMDYMMPIMDGMEAMRVIRQEKLCESTPVIMLTANTIKGEREKFLNAGFAEYVTKPFTVQSIKDVVLKYLPVDEEKLNQASWEPEWRMLQKELPFLRLSSAKEYFLSDADFYVAALNDYATTKIVQKLEEYVERSDYYNYRAALCSVKDSSKLIGADRISARAAEIEKLYMKGNIEELRVKHIAFTEEIKKMLKQLASALYLTERETGSLSEAGQFDARPLILVIDDDSVLCTAIENILKDYYRVIPVMTGEEGIIRAQEDAPALILLDVNLISMNGFDVIRALMSIEETAEIPVVLMTADDNGEAEIKGFKNGAADFIRKPFIPEVLIRRVRRIIELSALQKHLRREIVRQTEKIGHLSREVMLALSKAVDAKDKYTNDHSQRVAKYASWIGKQLGKSKQEQDDLYIIGLLHDVGKIGVHEEIINKPGRLTDEEYAEIKTHTTVGYDILKVITEMPEAAKCARWHHERYDGRGYPDGLAGTDIPENARIICVADAYDAMTSRRSYQALKPQQEVRDEMIRCRGTQFDPIITDAMVRIIDEDTTYELHG